MKLKFINKTLNRSLTILLLILTLTATVVVMRLAVYSDAFWSEHRSCFQSQYDVILNGRAQGDSQLPTDLQYTLRPPDFNLAPATPSVLDLDQFSDTKYNKLKEYQHRTLIYRRQFSCRKLFHSDSAEQSRVAKFHTQNHYNYTVTASEDVPAILTDCDAFKTMRGYRSDRGTPDEQQFPLAYVILVHKDFEHLERLLRMIYMPQHSICIHVDAKASASLRHAVSTLAGCFDNVILASQPQSIVYAHMSRLKADLVCMNDLLKLNTSWKYLINYAATELPLRSNLETVEILQSMRGLNDIHEQFERRKEERFTQEYIVVNGRMKSTRFKLPPPPYNLTVVKGQAYNTFSHAFLQWVFADEKPKRFLQWCNKTYSPDEHYWATLNDLYHNPFLNTPGGFKGHPDKKGYLTRFINWQYPTSQNKCYGKVIRHICIYSAFDLPLLLTQTALAANKFDLTYDPVAYACMEELNEYRSRSWLPQNLLLYKRLYFLNYHDPKR